MRPTTRATHSPSPATDPAMLKRILAAGLVGGIAGGIVVGAIESVTTVPMIIHAEAFEEIAATGLTFLAHAPGEHAHGGEEGGMRLILTFLATIAVAVGYAWMLLAVMYAKGSEITMKSVIPFAIAGFFATGLAPALGLAPELPGAAAADLEARQIWWAFTALATAIGIGAIYFGRSLPWAVGGLVLIVLPHVVGAPQPDGMASDVPAELAAHFASTSLVIHALIWIVPAAIAGYAMSRMSLADQTV